MFLMRKKIKVVELSSLEINGIQAIGYNSGSIEYNELYSNYIYGYS